MTNPARVLKRIFRSACLLAAAVSSAASAQTLSTIFSFDTSDGASPESQTLAQGRDGDLYGTALEGGSAPSFGTAFRITPQGSLGWYSFDGPHGAGPHAGLVLGIDERRAGE